MPDGLTVRTTALLVALAFNLTLAVQALLGGGSPAAQPVARKSAAGFVAGTPGAAPDLRLVAPATVPALREPRQPRKREVHTRKPKRSARTVVIVAPKIRPAPVMPAATVRPAPSATPRYPPPTPRRTTPKPATPKPTPAPTSAPPPSGEFDSSGEP